MNKKDRPTLLVAVRDLDRSAGQFLKKATDLAKRFDAKLNVVHVCSVPFAQNTTDTWSISQSAIDAFLGQQKDRLEKIVKPFAQGVHRIDCKTVWGYPAASELLREVAKTKPIVLLINTRQHSRLGRWFLSNTDWELIRHCPCPVWIAKSFKSPQRLAALAAVDPFHAHDKPARLDQAILDMARRIAGSQGRVAVCHAASLPLQFAIGMPEVALIPPTADDLRRHKADAARKVDRLIGKRRIARANRFVTIGEPVKALSDTARRWKADVLVSGAVSRSALKRLFVGNTAERLLDEVKCDVLVVKAPQSKTLGA